MSTVNVHKDENRQARMRAAEEHGGCFTIREAASLLHLHRDSARELLTSRGVLHRAPNAQGKTAPWHVTGEGLKIAYPELRRRHRPVKTRALTTEEAAELLGVDTIRPDTPEWDEAKHRMTER